LIYAIRNQQYNGRCLLKSAEELQLQFDPYLIEDTLSGRYRGCQIRQVAGYNQLYVNGSFSGNFIPASEDYRLRSAVARNIINGTCR
jgi:hypothetical protein